VTDDTLPVPSRGIRDEMIVFVVMAALARWSMRHLISVLNSFIDGAFCAARMCVQPAGLAAGRNCNRSITRCSWAPPYHITGLGLESLAS
jgi:hypothetical protein